jgi:hypothetical protein
MRDANTITAELIASGLSQAQTALLMELVLSMSTGLSTGQSGENPTLMKRRAWDRDRKHREREAKKLSTVSTGHPPDSTGIPPEKADICSDEEEKNRSLQEEKKLKKESKKGSRLLIGARPTNEQKLIAIECGCPPDRVDATWTEFVDYWSDIPGQKGCKLSWTGTWRNRIKYILGNGGFGNSPAGKPLTEFQRKQAETNDVRSQLRSMANGGRSGGQADRVLPLDNGLRPEDVRGGSSANLLALPRASGH